MKRIFAVLLLISTPTFSGVFNANEINTLKQHFLANVQANGAIVASPSQQNPNYYYDWIRDSAIAMGLIEHWYESSTKKQYRTRLNQYVAWTETIQHQYDPLPGHDILGEPKFYIDGHPFTGSWGRPQNDGPALRASVLIRFAQHLLNNNESDYVHDHLYNNSLNPNQMGIIKMDLEYIAHHWQEANFDLWEEVLGHHFYTAMVQQKALSDGAALARRLNDKHAAAFYETQALLINNRLSQHLDSVHYVIQSTLAPHPGPQKTLELDSSVILALLHNRQAEGPFSLDHHYVKNTIHSLHEQFNTMFPINDHAPGAILFGRYPGDTYDGYQNQSQGNPWFILTATMAEYYFSLAEQLQRSGKDQTLMAHYTHLGDGYLRLIKQYSADLYLSEQINLNTGVQQGARSLTWSYVAILRAIDLRSRIAD